MVPFLLGTVYASYRFQRFHPINFLLFFGALICIDMFTTALNNYLDFKRANKRHGYNFESHNAIVRDNIKESTVLMTIALLYAVAVLFGILLTVNTNIIVLGVGTLSFAVGILYSFGPLPISRMPLGELFSGLFMGFVIVFLSVYIHIYEMDVATLKITSLDLQDISLFLHVDIRELIFIFLLSLPAICGIANIMLANNICDIEDDLENRRYTLPVYIGRENALLLFKVMYYVSYLDIAVLAVLKLIPYICLASLLTLIPVIRNLKQFDETQSKNGTFDLSVKNFFLINTSIILMIFVALAASAVSHNLFL